MSRIHALARPRRSGVRGKKRHSPPLPLPPKGNPLFASSAEQRCERPLTEVTKTIDLPKQAILVAHAMTAAGRTCSRGRAKLELAGVEMIDPSRREPDRWTGRDRRGGARAMVIIAAATAPVETTRHFVGKGTCSRFSRSHRQQLRQDDGHAPDLDSRSTSSPTAGGADRSRVHRRRFFVNAAARLSPLIADTVPHQMNAAGDGRLSVWARAARSTSGRSAWHHPRRRNVVQAWRRGADRQRNPPRGSSWSKPDRDSGKSLSRQSPARDCGASPELVPLVQAARARATTTYGRARRCCWRRGPRQKDFHRRRDCRKRR